MWGFGLLVASAIALLMWRERCITRLHGPSQDSQLSTLR